MEATLFSEKLPKKKAIGLIHRLYVTQLKNSQIHTSTKTKSEVRGGGKKPRPQKGQGYARSGSTRSPLWVGGGVIFGPKPHTVSRKVNRKEKRLGIFAAFQLKKKEWQIINESSLTTEKSLKTKEFYQFINQFGINQMDKILVILSKPNKNVWLASRNLKNITLTTANSLNVENLLNTNRILFSNETLELITANYQKNYE